MVDARSDIQLIRDGLARLGISEYELCRRAHVSRTTLWRIKRGGAKRLNAPTMARLNNILDGKLAPVRAADASHVAVTYRGWVAHLAPKLGLDAAYVLKIRPAARANFNAQWVKAARVRELAVYCAVTELNISGAAMARAIGLTKQAVSCMLRRVEDSRDDPTVDAMIEDAAKLISGRAA